MTSKFISIVQNSPLNSRLIYSTAYSISPYLGKGNMFTVELFIFPIKPVLPTVSWSMSALFLV